MSKFFFVKQSSYINSKTKNSGLLTLLVDEKGNSIVTTKVGIIDPKMAH